MGLEQYYYTLCWCNWHWQSIKKELKLLQRFLDKNRISVNSAIDVCCGDGKVTKQLGDVLNAEILGADLNKSLLKKAEKRGVRTKRININRTSMKTKHEMVVCYGSLHHFKNTEYIIKKLKMLSSKYLLIVDLTVRDNFFHRITGSRWFIFEASKHPIRTKKEICETLQRNGCEVIDIKTNRNAALWHDRTFFLAKV